MKSLPKDSKQACQYCGVLKDPRMACICQHTPTPDSKQEWVTLENKVADIFEIPQEDRYCNGNHSRNGCIWEKCLAVSNLLSLQKQQIVEKLEGMEYRKNEPGWEKISDDVKYYGQGFNQGLQDAIKIIQDND